MFRVAVSQEAGTQEEAVGCVVGEAGEAAEAAEAVAKQIPSLVTFVFFSANFFSICAFNIVHSTMPVLHLISHLSVCSAY